MSDARLPSNHLYPISLDLRNRRVVVVGGGLVAERKVRGLREAGAAVTLIAPTCTASLQADAQLGNIVWRARAFEDADIEETHLLFVLTDDDVVNARISRLARERGILVNDAGDASRGTFVTPAVHRVGAITFAIETAGASPALAIRLREELRRRYDERYARAATLLAHMRDYAAAITDPDARAQALRELALRPIDELARLNPQQAEHILDEHVSGTQPPAPLTYVCATRSSALAMRQARWVMAKLATAGIASTIVEISSKGDQFQDRSIAAIGTDSVFVKELESALRERRADYAVHSCKDLPSTLPGDMHLAAIGARADARDAFCSERYASFDCLPAGAVVGTSSPRRRAQLQAMRSDLRYESIRGNVDTRLRKLRDGEYDALILAMAGLQRLGLYATHTVALDVGMLVPAVGQGALAIECRREDRELAALLHTALADHAVEIAVHAERAFLRRLQAGCQAPVGAYATYDGQKLTLHGLIAEVDGSFVVRGSKSVDISSSEYPEQSERLGEELAVELEAQGGAAILGIHTDRPLREMLVLLPRTREGLSRIAPALRTAGASVIEVSDSAQAQRILAGRIPDVLIFASSGSVRAVSQYLAGLRSGGGEPLVAVMGAASASAASQHGFPPNVIAPEASIPALIHSVTQRIITSKVKQ